jgi:hypothetical protein
LQEQRLSPARDDAAHRASHKGPGQIRPELSNS